MMAWNFEYSSRRTFNIQKNKFRTVIHNCKLCNYFSTSLIVIKNHIKRHRKVNTLFSCSDNTPEAFHCKDCGFTTYLTYEFMHHVNNHSHQPSMKFYTFDKEPETFFCHYCDFKTKLIALFIEHVLKHISLNGNTKKEFYCMKCNLHTTDMLSWIRHFYCSEEDVIRQEPPTTNDLPLQLKVVKRTRKKIKWLKCDKCFYQTYSQEVLHKHKMYNHTVKKKSLFRCRKCQFATPLKKGLSVHKERHKIQPKFFQCTRCNYYTELKDDILQHSKIHLLPEFSEWFECDRCPFKTKYVWSCYDHIKTHTSSKQRTFKCKQCSCTYRQKKLLKLHKCVKRVKFVCDKCSFRTRLKRKYDKHQKRHLICDGPLMTKLKLTTMQEAHTKKQEPQIEEHPKTPQSRINCENNCFQCEKCSFKTELRSDFETHTKQHELETTSQEEILPKTRQSSGSPFYCDLCSYKAYFPLYLQIHMNEKHFKNDKCSFKMKLRRQKQKKLFQCEKCSFKTQLGTRYRKHVKKHGLVSSPSVKNNHAPLETTELEHAPKSRMSRRNPLQCDLCPFKAYFSFHLQLHINEKHSARKVLKYQCKRCNYTTKKKTSLQRHSKKKHKQFQCKQCPYESSIETTLLKHVLKEHLTNWLRCDRCSFRTKSDYILRRHKVKKHSVGSEIPLNARHICSFCEYKTQNKRSLDVHLMKEHSEIDNVKYFQCDYCPYQTVIKYDFDRHILCRHTPLDEITLFNCTMCDFKAKTNGYLLSHIRKKHQE